RGLPAGAAVVRLLRRLRVPRLPRLRLPGRHRHDRRGSGGRSACGGRAGLHRARPRAGTGPLPPPAQRRRPRRRRPPGAGGHRRRSGQGRQPETPPPARRRARSGDHGGSPGDHRGPHAEVTTLLSVRGLTVHFGGVVALDHADLDVDAGRLVGLIGPNGAGKTTFIDAVCGFVPSSGTVALGGEPVDDLAPHERARRGIARTFQSLELFEDLTVRENLLVAAERGEWWTIGRDLLRPAEPPDVAATVDQALLAAGLLAHCDRLPAELTSSERGLVALARALAGHPRLLLFDEPAAGLDDAARTSLARRLRAL